MRDVELFQTVLCLESPWYVDRTEFDAAARRLDVYLDFERGGRFTCPEGREAKTFAAFREDVVEHGGDPDLIWEICMDMSPAYRKGARESLPLARITFDRFHVVKLLNEAVDQVRRAERKEVPELIRTRYLWLKNQSNLTRQQQRQLDLLLLSHTHLKTVKAYQMKLAFQDFWELLPTEAGCFLDTWFDWARGSDLPPMQRFAETVERHRDGILASGSAPASRTDSSKASPPSFRPPRPAPEDTDPPDTSSP